MIHYQIKPSLAELTPYEPLAGSYGIRLDANENFSPPDISGILESLKNVSLNRYPDPYADAACGAFAEFYNLPRELVTAGNGSDELIGLLVSAFLPRSGRVITLAPDFTMYGFYGNLSEMSVCVLPKDRDMNVDIPSVLDFIYRADRDVKSFRYGGGTPPAYANILLFSNPCNPTGQLIPREDVLRLAGEANALVVADEAYMDFYSGGSGAFSESVASEVSKYENLVVLKTASKAAGAAALRLGFAVSNEKITAALRAAKSPYNVNTLTNLAGAAVYSDKKKLFERILAMQRETAYLCKNLKLCRFPFFSHVYDTCTNFVTVSTPYAAKIDEHLRSHGIAVRAFPNGFANWGDHGFLRITAGSRSENDTLLETLSKFEVNA